MPEKWIIKQYQALPLRAKVSMSMNRIKEWYDHFDGAVCISFSGGKDSTVLAHLVHELYPDVPLVFANTGLEYPEIQSFARKMGAEFVRPKMSFSEVISTYGYPIISKEVAEAIHYARRIVPQKPANAVITERERERVQHSVQEKEGTVRATRRYGDDCSCLDSKGTAKSNGGGYSELQGRTGWRRANLTGETPPPAHGHQTARSQRDENERSEQCPGEQNGQGNGSWGKTDWHDWRRKCIAGVDEGFTGNSQFNKKKWLPLCNETQFMISHYCCSVMKKGPIGKYQRKNHVYPYIGTLAEESRMRMQAWVRHGCNSFDSKKKTSQPMSFWTEQDVLRYILDEGLEIASVYGNIVAVDQSGFEYEPFITAGCNLKCTGCQRTGCIFCGFGAHMEKGETRFQRLARTHPRQYEYCMSGGQWADNPKYDPAAPEMDGDWKNWNPKKIWVPSKEGLGMKHVFDECNQIYGKDFIRYE